MSTGSTLPRLNDLNSWMITKDRINAMNEEDFIAEVENEQTKVMVTKGEVSAVIITPSLYNFLIEAVNELAAIRAGESAM